MSFAFCNRMKAFTHIKQKRELNKYAKWLFLCWLFFVGGGVGVFFNTIYELFTSEVRTHPVGGNFAFTKL